MKHPNICNGKEKDYFIIESICHLSPDADNIYINDDLALKKSKEHGVDDCIVFNSDGTVEIGHGALFGTWNENSYTIEWLGIVNTKNFKIEGDMLTVEFNNDKNGITRRIYRRSDENGILQNVSGDKTYANKNFSVLVPEGWKAIELTLDGEIRQDMINIHKGATSNMDAFYTPCVTVMYVRNAPYQIPPPKSFYNNVADITPFTAGKYDFTGFSGEILNKPCIVFWSKNDKEYVQITICTEVNGKKIAFEDADVQAIIASVTMVND